jgi:DNA-binding NtrC family response regulator
MVAKLGRNEDKAVVVSFAARDGDPYARVVRTGQFYPGASDDPLQWGPTLRALTDTRSELYGRVSDWYYLCHPAETGGTREVGRTAAEVARDTKRAIAKHLPAEARPHFHIVEWKTDRPPNDHKDLFETARRELLLVRAAHPGKELVLVLSSGTAPMAAVLLLVGSVGIVDGPIRLVQVERNEGARLRAEKPVVDVTLKLETVLQIASRTTPATPLIDEIPTSGYHQARSPALRHALEQARIAARLPFPVLLRGERGVGKSRLATVIRAASSYRKPERDRKWPAVACGQFPDPQRLMVELCGSVKGAFTGAENHSGLLALAHEDTLFLDEIHDLSAANQRVIIRTLEDKKYYRVGSNSPLTSDFRLITGTNQPDEVLGNCLTPDFFDRIRDIEIRVPPLRDCREDLPWMWHVMWRHVAARAGLNARELDDNQHARIVHTVERHELAGNWRDLRRLAIRLAVIVHGDGQVSASAMSAALEAFFANEGGIPSGMPAAARRSRRLMTKQQTRRQAELETRLGAGFQDFWRRCDGGEVPRVVLQELLGNRDRAARAEKFIARTFPERWGALLR